MASKSTADRAVWIAYNEEPDNRVPLSRIIVCSSEIAARRVAMNMMDDGAVVRVPFGDSILDAVIAKDASREGGDVVTVAGYEIDRNEEGLTARERVVYDRLIAGETFQEIGDAIGITRQRVGQVAAALVAKGALVRQGVGRYAVPIKRKGASA